MRVISCSDPLSPRQVDPAYLGEHEAARALGIATSLISYEALVDEGDAQRAARRVEPSGDSELGVYLGWMLRPEAYDRRYAMQPGRVVSATSAGAGSGYDEPSCGSGKSLGAEAGTGTERQHPVVRLSR